MTLIFTSRRQPALTPLAAACALILAAAPAAHAQVAVQAAAPAQSGPLPEVTVTGPRFASDPALLPIGATVITAADIRRAGVSDANQAIRKLGGVYGRQSLDNSPDFALDLRGFGSTSSQNLVVMVDGVRINENELANPVLSTIPVEAIERIEIQRGGAGVLYGEGATGGVIQVFTKRGAGTGTRGSLRAEAGSFDTRDLRANVATSFNQVQLDAAVAHLRTDRYRAHSAFEQTSANLGALINFAGGRAGLRHEQASSDSQFPGSLTMAQFNANPRQAHSLRDFGSMENRRSTAFAEWRVGGLELAADLSRRTRDVEACYFTAGSNTPYQLHYSSEQSQFSPRVRYLSELGGQLNELVAGVDLTRWERDAVSSFSTEFARQKSRALYLRDELKWNAPHNLRLAAGVRRERFEKDLVAFTSEQSTQYETAWEVQGSVDVAPQVNLYAKLGRSYRVPNADENGYRSSMGVLDIQTSRDIEAGVRYALGSSSSLTGRLFRHRLTDEIYFDPTINGFGANTNLDPTEREGAELEAALQLAPAWRLTAQWQHVRARFTEGAYAGRDMVLVPRNVVSTRLAWVPATGHSADIGAQWVSKQRYGGDFANTCSTRMPSYATLDARYARSFGPWELAVSGLNLTDRQYFNQAFGCRTSIYPSDGRAFKVSLRYDF